MRIKARAMWRWVFASLHIQSTQCTNYVQIFITPTALSRLNAPLNWNAHTYMIDFPHPHLGCRLHLSSLSAIEEAKHYVHVLVPMQLLYIDPVHRITYSSFTLHIAVLMDWERQHCQEKNQKRCLFVQFPMH